MRLSPSYGGRYHCPILSQQYPRRRSSCRNCTTRSKFWPLRSHVTKYRLPFVLKETIVCRDESRIQDGQGGVCVGNDWLLDNAHQSGVFGITSTSTQCLQITYHLNCLGQASVSLYAAIQTRLQPTRPLGFLSSWLLLVFPLLLSMTLFANQPTLFLVLLSVSTGLVLLYLPKPQSGIPLPLRQPLLSSATSSSNPVRIPPLPALTTYRAHMMLMTVLAILAVDFPVFPRSMVKCETFGVSLV
jgi:hypothetical protein